MNPSEYTNTQPTPQPIIPNKENNIFDLIIKISISAIILLLIAIPLIIFKPWNSLQLSTPSFINTEDQTKVEINKYLEISNPIYSLTGTISKIKKNQITLEVPISTGTTNVLININIDTSITQVPTSTYGDLETESSKKLSPNDLKVKDSIVITTVEDLRNYDGTPLNASIITVLHNPTQDTVQTIDENEN